MIKLRDNLWSRILEDHVLFFAFAGGGAIAIVAAKALTNWPMGVIALGAVALMVVYAVLVSSKGVGKLRADQAGDNCYYLGLIYTLTSLGHAIFTYDPSGTSNEIVNGFGVALATTIVGLVLRVGFNQSRLDIYEIEGQARLELVEAAAQMKTKLAQVTELIGGLGDELRQSMDDMRRATEESVENASATSVKAIEGLATTAGEHLSGQVEAFRGEVDELSKFTAKSKEALVSHSDVLEEVTAEHVAAAKHLAKIREAVEATSALGEKMREQQSSLDTYRQSIVSSSSDVAAMTTGLQGATDKAVSAISSAAEQLEARVKQLQEAPGRTVTAAAEAMEAAVQQLEAAISGVAQRYGAAGEAIEASATDLVTALGSHNHALDEELEKSRSNVAKVHSALVEMTDELRTQVGQADTR